MDLRWVLNYLVIGVTAAMPGCENAPPPQAVAAGPQSGPAVPNAIEELQYEYRPNARHGITEVFAVGPNAAAERIRILPTPERGFTATEREEWLRRDRRTEERRRAAAEPLTRPQTSPERRHESWLEAAARLDAALLADPGHLGLRRDQLTAQLALLGYEQGSPFAAGFLRSTAAVRAEFVSRAQPPEPGDVELATRVEAWLFYHQHAFPAAAATAGKLGDEIERRTFEQLLAAVGMRKFHALPSWTVGQTTVAVWRTVGRPPSPEFLWPEWHFLVAPTASPGRPDRIAAYTLDVRGPPGAEKFYLRTHVDGRTTIVVPYGHARPNLSLVKYHVMELVAAAMRAADVAKEGSPP